MAIENNNRVGFVLARLVRTAVNNGIPTSGKKDICGPLLALGTYISKIVGFFMFLAI